MFFFLSTPSDYEILWLPLKKKTKKQQMTTFE
jgi:hypothetical protein